MLFILNLNMLGTNPQSVLSLPFGGQLISIHCLLNNGSKLSCFSICSSTTTRGMKMTRVVSNVGQCVSINFFLFKIACGNVCARVCKINVCMVNTQSRVAFFVIKVLKINQNATNSHKFLLQTFNSL